MTTRSSDLSPLGLTSTKLTNMDGIYCTSPSICLVLLLTPPLKQNKFWSTWGLMQTQRTAEAESPSTTASSRWKIILTAVQLTQLRVSQVSAQSRTLKLRCQTSGTRHRCTMQPRDALQSALYTFCSEVLNSSQRTSTGTHHLLLHWNENTLTTASYWFRRMQT